MEKKFELKEWTSVLKNGGKMWISRGTYLRPVNG